MKSLIPPVNNPVEIIPGLYQSGLIFGDSPIRSNGIQVVFDLEGGFDKKTIANFLTLYVHWKIEDGPLPGLEQLFKLTSLAYWYHSKGMRILTHCQLGLNRSSLFNGMILYERGMRGEEITQTIKKVLPFAFSNQIFKQYIEGLL